MTLSYSNVSWNWIISYMFVVMSLHIELCSLINAQIKPTEI